MLSAKIKRIVKHIGIYSVVIVGIGGWIWGLNKDYFANKYIQVDLSKEVTDLKESNNKVATDLKESNNKVATDTAIFRSELIKALGKNSEDHINIVNDLKNLDVGQKDIKNRMTRLEDVIIKKENTILGSR